MTPWLIETSIGQKIEKLIWIRLIEKNTLASGKKKMTVLTCFDHPPPKRKSTLGQRRCPKKHAWCWDLFLLEAPALLPKVQKHSQHKLQYRQAWAPASSSTECLASDYKLISSWTMYCQEKQVKVETKLKRFSDKEDVASHSFDRLPLQRHLEHIIKSYHIFGATDMQIHRIASVCDVRELQRWTCKDSDSRRPKPRSPRSSSFHLSRCCLRNTESNIISTWLYMDCLILLPSFWRLQWFKCNLNSSQVCLARIGVRVIQNQDCLPGTRPTHPCYTRHLRGPFRPGQVS